MKLKRHSAQVLFLSMAGDFKWKFRANEWSFSRCFVLREWIGKTTRQYWHKNVPIRIREELTDVYAEAISKITELGLRLSLSDHQGQIRAFFETNHLKVEETGIAVWDRYWKARAAIQDRPLPAS